MLTRALSCVQVWEVGGAVWSEHLRRLSQIHGSNRSPNRTWQILCTRSHL